MKLCIVQDPSWLEVLSRKAKTCWVGVGVFFTTIHQSTYTQVHPPTHPFQAGAGESLGINYFGVHMYLVPIHSIPAFMGAHHQLSPGRLAVVNDVIFVSIFFCKSNSKHRPRCSFCTHLRGSKLNGPLAWQQTERPTSVAPNWTVFLEYKKGEIIKSLILLMKCWVLQGIIWPWSNRKSESWYNLVLNLFLSRTNMNLSHPKVVISNNFPIIAQEL